ncbi:unnamed protein product [Arctogadus glacialis]
MDGFRKDLSVCPPEVKSSAPQDVDQGEGPELCGESLRVLDSESWTRERDQDCVGEGQGLCGERPRVLDSESWTRERDKDCVVRGPESRTRHHRHPGIGQADAAVGSASSTFVVNNSSKPTCLGTNVQWQWQLQSITLQVVSSPKLVVSRPARCQAGGAPAGLRAVWGSVEVLCSEFPCQKSGPRALRGCFMLQEVACKQLLLTAKPSEAKHLGLTVRLILFTASNTSSHCRSKAVHVLQLALLQEAWASESVLLFVTSRAERRTPTRQPSDPHLLPVQFFRFQSARIIRIIENLSNWIQVARDLYDVHFI